MLISNFKKVIAQHQWRNYYLVLIAVGTSVVAIYALINPRAGNQPIANFEFPKQIQLDSGTFSAAKESSNLAQNSEQSQVAVSRQEKIKSTQQYQYVRDGLETILEINYLVNTRGEVESYLQQYTNISSEAIKNKTIAHTEAVGYYALLEDNDRAYLSSCVSPRSLSNVTQKQFSHYRYQNDLKLQIGWEWLLGKSSIRDRRCLWVHLSTPLVADSQTAYQTLETTWQEVYLWGSQNFPPLH